MRGFLTFRAKTFLVPLHFKLHYPPNRVKRVNWWHFTKENQGQTQKHNQDFLKNLLNKRVSVSLRMNNAAHALSASLPCSRLLSCHSAPLSLPLSPPTYSRLNASAANFKEQNARPKTKIAAGFENKGRLLSRDKSWRCPPHPPPPPLSQLSDFSLNDLSPR